MNSFVKWTVIGFFNINNVFVDLSDTYRIAFNQTAKDCEMNCMFDVRCYGYFYEFSNPRNTGCYLKGDPNNFEISRQQLRPSLLGVKVRPWKR
jgi:hypothetical protein